MARKVRGLRWAKELASRPKCIPQGRVRGAKALGLRYEKALARALPMAKAGVWWEFEDLEGHGYCQTDLLIVGKSFALVLEAKYTETEEAWDQLEALYSPVVSLALAKPVLGVQVAFQIRVGLPSWVCEDLAQAIGRAKLGQRPLLHWSGFGPLWPRCAGAKRPEELAVG